MAKKILNHKTDRQTKPPPKYTITEHEFYIIQRVKERVVELCELTDNDESYHAVNTLLAPIYEDLSKVLDNAQEVSVNSSEVLTGVGNLDELGYAIEEIQAVYAELRKNTGLEELQAFSRWKKGVPNDAGIT